MEMPASSQIPAGSTTTESGERAPTGPSVNDLTSSAHCDPRTKTPFHKGVPVQVEALAEA